MPEAAPVTLVVYDILGRQVVTLVDQNQSAGRHMVTFDASGLASGIYFYMIKSNDFHAMKKMVLVK